MGSVFSKGLQILRVCCLVRLSGQNLRIPHNTDLGTGCVAASTLLLVRPTNCRTIFFLHFLPRPASSSDSGACPSTLRWFSFAGWLGLAIRTPSFKCSHSYPTVHISSRKPSCHVSEASFFTSFGQTTFMSTATSRFKQQSVPLWPLDVEFTGLAHDGSRQSSHLSPCLHFEDLLPPRLHLLFSPSSEPDTLRTSKSNHGGKFSLNFQIFPPPWEERAKPTPPCLLRRDAHGLSSSHSRKDQVHPPQPLLTPVLVENSWKTRITPGK